MKRETRQRRAIQNILREATRPLRPEEILEKASGPVPGIGQATVYRTINALQEEGRIVPVMIPGQPTRYEKADLKHHHHFSCTGCGRVYELKGCSYNANAAVPAGFNVESHEVILYGTCRACRA